MRNPVIWKRHAGTLENGTAWGYWTRREIYLTGEEKQVLAYRGPKQTEQRIKVFERNGWTIIDGNDWRLPTRGRYLNYFVVRLAQTNHKRHGKCIRTVFAVRKYKNT
jgi:hypothetical protein